MFDLQKFLEAENDPAPRVIFLTGAGADAPSGIPTFRGDNGLWGEHKIEEVCDIDSFVGNYEAVHKFYDGLRASLSKVKPNLFHEFLVEKELEYGPERFIHFTTNVSDLTERIGGSCQHVHGELTKVVRDWSRDTRFAKVEDIGYEQCDLSNVGEFEIIKPAVVFFGEYFRWDGTDNQWKNLYGNVSAAIDSLRMQDTAFVVGSSDQVLDFSVLLSHSNCRKVLVNPQQSQGMFPYAYKHHLALSCEEALQNISEILNERMFN